MFPIYLFEDNVEQRNSYREIINKTIMINEFAMELRTVTDDQKAILTSLDQKNGLFFLDMEIGENKQAGLELATQVRTRLPLAKIVFITTHDELSFVTLERRIAPLDYILKDQSPDLIEQRIVKDINVVQDELKTADDQREDVFNYKLGARYFSFALDDVILLSTCKLRPGNVQLQALHKTAEFPGNLNALEEKYPSLFRCDKSSLVNLHHIQSYDSRNKELLLDAGIRCKVSFRKSRELNKILKDQL
ncbi:response regulator [Lactobacillus pentosus]|uniref:DNA-binding response regulator n=1 Tax=Lactiplantibacillus pentosus TaxID=1589 RepID=A0AB37RGS6_LACPE|nr:response regulator transcription factor [Lactiplantibacillus pentosus]MCH4129466.1 response regulator transcription factor [Lactiplantibacillus sp.]BBM21343.1 response regulator PlnD, repressor [Lactiplantibacillus plantarum]MCT3291630.1 response regulator [Lactiplantibacillus pentosus]MPQ19173.1 response regulator [Lactiplantibacillus pentosus]RMW46885.1 DNA-binding response regulator [Lactiplantibacillus pentosus]